MLESELARGRCRAYASDATGPTEWRFCWSSRGEHPHDHGGDKPHSPEDLYHLRLTPALAPIEEEQRLAYERFAPLIDGQRAATGFTMPALRVSNERIVGWLS